MNQASRGRFTLLRLALALSIITYLDRVAISSAALVMRGELHLTVVQMGWVFSVFTFAYAVFEIPSGWLGDVIVGRRDWSTKGAGANRTVVVRLHDGDRDGVEFRVIARRAISFRRWRGWSVPKHFPELC
jgi:hypothetical protein